MNEISQEVSAEILNKRFGCDKMGNYHKTRLCQINGRILLLKGALRNCTDVKCRAVYISKIKKWTIKLNDVMASNVNRRIDSKSN